MSDIRRRHQVGRQQRLGQVEDQVRVTDLQQVQNPFDVLLVDDTAFGDFQRVAEDRQAARFVLRHTRGGGSSCRAAQCCRARSEIEMFSKPLTSSCDVGVAQGEVEVDGRSPSRSRGRRPSVAARFTARVVVPTPREPRTADQRGRRFAASSSLLAWQLAAAGRLRPSAPAGAAASMSSRPTGCVKKYFAFLQRLQQGPGDRD